jgi:putative sigma-54 modulation protein
MPNPEALAPGGSVSITVIPNYIPMDIQFQATNFKADGKLLEFITRKLEKLQTFHDRILKSEVYLKVNKADDKDNKIVEIRMHVGKWHLFAEERARNFELAADQATEALRSQISTLKSKQSAQG